MRAWWLAGRNRDAANLGGDMMKWWPPALLLLGAAASVCNLFVLFLENLMSPGWSIHEPLALRTLAAIVVMTLAGLVLPLALGVGRARPWLLVLTALVVAAGFVPRVVVAEANRERAAEAAQRARESEAKREADIAARQRDVETRIAASRAYSPDEAWAFVNFVMNLGYQDAKTRSPAVAALQQALEGKLIDPNAMVKGRYANDRPEPLFVHYHGWIRQVPERSVMAHHWQIMLLLVRGGADLSVPEAARVAADLRKTATPELGGLYLKLE
jgi:hypothetical protein